MSGFVTALRWDVVLQARNGFYWASIFLVLLVGGLLLAVPGAARADRALWVPAVLAVNLQVTTFFFVAGLLLLDRDLGDAHGAGGLAAVRPRVPRVAHRDTDRAGGGGDACGDLDRVRLRALVTADARLLIRDPLLGWVALLPLGLALLFRVLTPPAAVALDRAGFDLVPYYPLLMGGYLMTAPGIVGMVIGFLLLDERDARTLAALRVTPLSMRRYLAYRVALPLAGGTAATLVGYPLTGLVPLPLGTLLPLAVIAGFSAPMLALVLATAAPNKVAGFAVTKVVNGTNLLPIAAFFLPVRLQWMAGVLPPYWPMRALWSAAAGEPYAGYLLAGTVVNILALVLAMTLFERRLLRRG